MTMTSHFSSLTQLIYMLGQVIIFWVVAFSVSCGCQLNWKHESRQTMYGIGVFGDGDYAMFIGGVAR